MISAIHPSRTTKILILGRIRLLSFSIWLFSKCRSGLHHQHLLRCLQDGSSSRSKGQNKDSNQHSYSLNNQSWALRSVEFGCALLLQDMTTSISSTLISSTYEDHVYQQAASGSQCCIKGDMVAGSAQILTCQGR